MSTITGSFYTISNGRLKGRNERLCIVSLKRESQTDEEMKAFLVDLSKQYEHKQRFYLLINTTKVGKRPASSHMALMKEWVRKQNDQSKKWLICTCVVISNNIIRLLMKVFLPLINNASPIHICANTQEAKQFIMK
jgi:hypothetical protein